MPGDDRLDQKKHGSLKDFFAKLFADKNNLKFFLISFLGFILIFGAIATGVIIISNMPKKVTTTASNSSSSGTASYTPSASDGFNVMILGFNDFNGPVKSIQLMRVDPAKGQMAIISFPTFTLSQTDNQIRSLTDCYNQGGSVLLTRALEDITGANIDYYVMIDLSGFSSILSKLGKIDFTLTTDIDYTDNTDPLNPIHYVLKKGENSLDAADAVVVMRYPQYAGGDVDRGNIHAQFIKALITQKLNSSLLNDAESLYIQYSPYVQTNFSVPDLVTHLDAIKYVISLGGDQIQYLELPGGTKILQGKSYYEIDNTQVADMFTTYFGAK